MVTRVLVILLIGLGWQATALAAMFEVSVDKRQLSTEEHLLLTMTLTNSDLRLRAEGVDPNIDLSLLGPDFALGKPEASHFYNVHQGRGRSTSEIKVQLFPKRSGELRIPSFQIDGLSSKPITIRSNPASEAAPEVFVRAGSNLQSAWLNQQLVIWLDLYHRVELQQASFGDQIATEPTFIDLIPHWQLEQSERSEQLHGFDYQVQRSAWAIFPQTTGEFRAYLPDIWLTTAEGRQQRLLHQEIKVDVKALPAGIPADIIIGQPKLSSEDTPADGLLRGEQHQLKHWRLTLEAPTAIGALPKYLPLPDFPEGLRVYPDRAEVMTTKESGGINDIARYNLALMGLQPGRYQLPPIEIPYFDPELGTIKTARLTPPALDVKAAPLLAAENQAVLNAQLDHAAPDLSLTHPGLWPWATALFAMLWLLTAGAWWRQTLSLPTIPVDDAAATPTLPAGSRQRPLEAQLLRALGCRSLQAGIEHWQQIAPEDQTTLATLHAVQAHYYASHSDDGAALEARVQQALTQITQARPTNPAANEDWQQRVLKP